MKLKTLPLATLLLLLTMQTSFAESKTESNQIFENGYGIDLNKNYSGSEALRMIEIVEQEAEQTIDEAFNEGYRQGLLSGVPEAEYWKARYIQLEREFSKATRQKWLFALGGFTSGLITGWAFGFTIRIQN